MATYSSILAWRIPWTEEPVRLQSLGYKESDTTEATEHSTRCRSQLMLTLSNYKAAAWPASFQSSKHTGT